LIKLSNETRTSAPKLRRALGLRDLYFAGLTAVIGSGWLFASFLTSSVAGPASIISWIVGGIFIIFIALAWAEVSTSVPVAGGAVRYASYTHGSIASSIIAWSTILTYIAVPAVEAVAIIQTVGAALPVYGITSITLVSPTGLPTGLGVAVAFLLSLLFFYLNYIGVRSLANANTVMSTWKLMIPPIAIIALLIFGLSKGLGSNFTTPSFAPFGFAPVFTAIPATGVIFAYLGFRQPIEMAAEAKVPGKDIWRAILFVVGTSMVINTLLQIAFIGALEWNSPAFGSEGVGVGQWSGLGTSLPMYSFPFFYEAVGLGIGALAILLAIDGAVSPAGTLHQYMGSTPRVTFGTAKEGLLPASFLKIHPKYRIPVVGLIATLAVTLILLVLASVGALVSTVGGAWPALTSIITTTGVFSYIMGPIALPIFRRSYPEAQRPFSIPAYNILAPIAFIVAALMTYWGAGSLIAPPSDPYGGYILLVVMLAGVFLYGFQKDKKPGEFKTGLWVIVFLLFNLVLLYLGEYQTNIIKLPYDWIVDIVGAIVFYIWAMRSQLPPDTVKQSIQRVLSQPEGE